MTCQRCSQRLQKHCQEAYRKSPTLAAKSKQHLELSEDVIQIWPKLIDTSAEDKKAGEPDIFKGWE